MSTTQTHPDVLSVRDLSVRYPGSPAPAVDDVSFTIAAGSTLALVGDSGSGKTSIALALTRLQPRRAGVCVSGEVRLRTGGGEEDLLTLPPERLRQLRGSGLAMVFQEPAGSLNPVMRVQAQLLEALLRHKPFSKATARRETAAMLTRVGIGDPHRVLRCYPHQLSGGMQQRVMIAMALAGDPTLLVADEPSSALDVTVQAQILDLLSRLQRETGMALLLITHDMGVVALLADQVGVLERGRLVERGPTAEVFARPKSPSTVNLLRAAQMLCPGGRLP